MGYHVVIRASRAGPLGSTPCSPLRPPLRDLGLTILSKSLTIGKGVPNISATLLDFGKSNNIYKAISEFHETCLEGKLVKIPKFGRDTKRDHLNFELVTFKFGLTLSEFNTLNSYAVGMCF